MPHLGWLIVGVGIAAGIYAGYQWLVGASERPAVGKGRSRHGARRAATPRDLGRLVWDEAVGAYRPA